MPEFGYYLSLEHESADTALATATRAERSGFDMLTAADHFHPWFDSHPDGRSANAADCWTWLPAALEATDSMRLGPSGTAMLGRHHPADVAQRLATLQELAADRVFLGVGTGTAMNELPLGYPWPGAAERVRRTASAIRLIRRLFAESFVDHDGEFWTLDGANLYAGGSSAPPIHVAAGGTTTARLAGDLGDGLLTVYRDPDRFRDELRPAFETGVEQSDRNGSAATVPKTMLLNCSYAEDERAAVEACRPLAGSLLPVFFEHGVADPRYIQRHGEKVGADQLREEFLVATDADPIIDAVETYVDCGFDRILLHDNSPDRAAFCDLFARDIAPSFD
jgi:coenzyme F420-dependent glucose-6-phosphate dehydrogenase